MTKISETHVKDADAVDHATGNEGVHGEKLHKGHPVTETVETGRDPTRTVTKETTVEED